MGFTIHNRSSNAAQVHRFLVLLIHRGRGTCGTPKVISEECWRTARWGMGQPQGEGTFLSKTPPVANIGRRSQRLNWGAVGQPSPLAYPPASVSTQNGDGEYHDLCQVIDWCLTRSLQIRRQLPPCILTRASTHRTVWHPPEAPTHSRPISESCWVMVFRDRAHNHPSLQQL